MKFNKRKLKKERLALKMTASDFARALQKYVPTANRILIANWEQKGQNPSYEYLDAICKITNKPIDFYIE